MNFSDYFLFLSTALLWGVTNVLIKRNTKGIKEINVETSKWKQIYAEFRYLLLNYKVKFHKNLGNFTKFNFHIFQYFLSFGINQLGSILYFYDLQRKTSSLSVAVILTNSLTLLITTISSLIIEKKKIGVKTIFGAVLITLGSSLICIANG